MGNKIKIHSVQLLQNHWPAFPFLFCRKSLSVPSNFCQDTRVSVGFLCYISCTAAGVGGAQRYQCMALVPQLHCADVSGTVVSASQGWEVPVNVEEREVSTGSPFSDALALQLPLCARGWQPSHSRGRVEGKGKNWRREVGRGGERLERGILQVLGSGSQLIWSPHPRRGGISLLLLD